MHPIIPSAISHRRPDRYEYGKKRYDHGFISKLWHSQLHGLVREVLRALFLLLDEPVGVDIAQQTHVARAVNFRGIILGDPLSFSNDEDEFSNLLHWIHKLQNAHNLSEAIVGMEPTGHYWLNWSRWLAERQFQVVLVNPHLVKKNKENRDNTPFKSDKKDAFVIADMVKNGYYSFTRNTPEAFEERRVLLSNRDSVVTRLVSAKNQIHRWVDVVFPELRHVFKHIILGEAGDLSGFVHGNALMRHVGLNLAEASSGKWTGQMVISKRGRSRLRRFIFMMTMSLVMTNPEFKAVHSHNVEVKRMKKMRSVMKLCGKLARMLVGMARSGEAYAPHKTLPLQQTA